MASDGDAEDSFGSSVAISGSTIVVGSWLDDDNGDDSGAVYIYEDTDNGIVETQKLTASDGASDDWFGSSVAISGSMIVVGASRDGDRGTDSGSVYHFEHDGSEFVENRKLNASNGASGDRFGSSVAISGSTVVVGAWSKDENGERSGAAYVFEDDGGGFAETRKLVPEDGAAGDRFGVSVAVSGSTIVVGAQDDNDSGEKSGSAYVFEDDGSGFAQTRKLLPADGVPDAQFGAAVAVSGSTIVVGARGDDNGGSVGSAYIFERQGSVFAETQKLLPGEAVPGGSFGGFGSSVAVSGSTILVGAHSDDDNGQDSGSVYVYTNGGSGFVELQKLLSEDGASRDWFGWSVAASGTTIVVGSPTDDNENGENSGSTYVYDVPGL